MSNSINVKVTQLVLCYFQNINIHLKQVPHIYLMIGGTCVDILEHSDSTVNKDYDNTNIISFDINLFCP
jgi:hypothetical protein